MPPLKLHVKSHARCETGEFHSHSRQYPGTRSLYSPNCFLSYQFGLVETLRILAPTLQHCDAVATNCGDFIQYNTPMHISFTSLASLP